jgi:hypothetical protein
MFRRFESAGNFAAGSTKLSRQQQTFQGMGGLKKFCPGRVDIPGLVW